MPATRRQRNSSGGPAAKGSQSTLSFGGSRSKITKSSVPILSKDKNEIVGDVKDVKVEAPTAEPITIKPGHVTSEAAVVEQSKVELSKPTSKAEVLAGKVTSAQIKKYWQEREVERIAPRVHQKELSVEEKILRYFDASSQYGPCIGIARKKRWVRAQKLGLNPPIEILAVLLKEERRGNAGIERAYIDELMSSTLVVGGE